MVDVTVIRRYKSRQGIISGMGGYSYATSSGSAVASEPINSPPGVVVTPYPEPAIYEFTDTDNPTIANFDTLYAPTYGRNPRFTLIVYENALESGDSENELVQYVPPKINVTNDVIMSVEYDLSGLGVVSGKIIINK